MTTADRARPARVRVTRRLPALTEARLRELFDTRTNPDDTPMDAAALAAAMADCDVLVPTVTDRIDAAAIAAAGPELRLIANFGNGVDHIDLAAAEKRGIVVTNTPGVLTDDTADLAIALMLMVARRLPEGARQLAEGAWRGWAPTGPLGRRLAGMTLGIVGMGRIGQAVAHRARAFGLDIEYHNRRRLPHSVEAPVAARYRESLDDLLASADIVSLHCPHTAATTHLLSAERLARMKPSAMLINTARGEVVDEAALVGMLESGRLAGAGLDVYEREPAVDPRLPHLPGVVALPHMGSATEEARVAMGEKVLINIKSFVDGHKPPDRVIGAWL